MTTIEIQICWVEQREITRLFVVAVVFNSIELVISNKHSENWVTLSPNLEVWF